ncbi:hypothetical protein SV7mr_21290 [Stieleria bergensis]|uniref:Uncharacterized protein n=1 Tax=Stieleria bergensis TaxID=2528025 RepID=A0A517SU35_9BACT|nr:hypothetical protein SV7mr_21290 [Planctomycetes bacterium SV_7m_r]
MTLEGGVLEEAHPTTEIAIKEATENLHLLALMSVLNRLDGIASPQLRAKFARKLCMLKYSG